MSRTSLLWPGRPAFSFRRVRALFRALLLAVLAGCEHGAPYAIGDYGSSGPLVPGSPRQLTFNPGTDRMPSWLPDGSGLLYSMERLDRADRDRCLGVLPADGGSLRRTICNRVAASDDSTDVFEAPAAAPDGRLVYVRASSRVGAYVPLNKAIVMASVDDPGTARLLRSIPYTLPGRPLHLGVSHIGWLDSTSLVYLAEFAAVGAPCDGCAVDTVASGLEIVRADLSGASPTFSAILGTDDASSVAVGESADAIYYTVIGDSRVFRRVLSTGTTTVVYDFAPAGVARDVHVAQGKLVAVVGGDVSYGSNPTFGYIQLDAGGELHLLNLVTGTDVMLPGGGRLYRRPVLSPDGRRVAAEAMVGRRADLWLFEVP